MPSGTPAGVRAVWGWLSGGTAVAEPPATFLSPFRAATRSSNAMRPGAVEFRISEPLGIQSEEDVRRGRQKVSGTFLQFEDREITMPTTDRPIGSVIAQRTPSGPARTEARPTGTLPPGRNAVGGGVGGPPHSAVGRLPPLEGAGPFVARVPVLRQSTDGIP